MGTARTVGQLALRGDTCFHFLICWALSGARSIVLTSINAGMGAVDRLALCTCFYDIVFCPVHGPDDRLFCFILDFG